MFLLKMGSGKTIDWVDTLSFIMSKNQKNYDFSIVIETLVRNLSHFFAIIKTRRKDYLPSQKIILSDPVFRFFKETLASQQSLGLG